jgi:mRNA interferase RelE/StbE
MYQVIISKKCQKEIDAIPSIYREEIVSTIAALAINPRPIGTVKLSGFESTYRVRVSSYRIVYTIDDGKIIVKVERVADRKDVYK